MAHLRPLFSWRSAIVESDLPPTTRHVALTLSLHMNERGGSCFPSQSTLAAETGLHHLTVRKHLGELTAGGWLTRVIRRRGVGRGTRTEYEATVPTTDAENSGGLNSGGLNGAVLDDDQRCAGHTTRDAQDSCVEDDMNTSREEGPLSHFEILVAMRKSGSISLSLPRLAEIADGLRALGVDATEPAIAEAMKKP